MSRSNTPKSVRLPDKLHYFIENSSFNFSEEVRKWLRDKETEYAAGRCASCGVTVYVGDHTVTSGTTPLGKNLGIDENTTIDLCPQCSEEAYDSVTDENITPPELTELEDNKIQYTYERLMIAETQPDSDWLKPYGKSQEPHIWPWTMLTWAETSDKTTNKDVKELRDEFDDILLNQIKSDETIENPACL